MPPSLDVRRRRAAYRATHRGTKELDLMIGRFAGAHVATMDDAALARFERLLAVPDPDLDAWIRTGGAPVPTEFQALIAAIRRSLGIATDADTSPLSNADKGSAT